MTRKPYERLRQARIEKGFETPTDVARSFGWTVPTYVSHENGTRNLTQEAAKRYASALGVSPGWLLGLSDVDQEPTSLVAVTGVSAFGVWRQKNIDDPSVTIRQSFSVPRKGGAKRAFCCKNI